MGERQPNSIPMLGTNDKRVCFFFRDAAGPTKTWLKSTEEEANAFDHTTHRGQHTNGAIATQQSLPMAFCSFRDADSRERDGRWESRPRAQNHPREKAA